MQYTFAFFRLLWFIRFPIAIECDGRGGADLHEQQYQTQLLRGAADSSRNNEHEKW